MTVHIRDGKTITNCLCPWNRDCVKFFEYKLEKTQERNKGLIVELGHPCNIHRWRHLLVRLHEQYPINKSAVNGNNNTKTNTNVFGYMLLSGMM